MAVPGDDEEGYFGYIPTTTDPGVALLIGTLVVCFILNLLLPFFVACGSYRDKERKKRVEDNPWSIRQSNEENKQRFMTCNERQSPRSLRSLSEVDQSLGLSGIARQRTPQAPSILASSIFSHGHASVVSSVATTALSQSVIHSRRGRTQRRFRRALEKHVTLTDAGIKADSFFRFDQPTTNTYYQDDRQKVDDDEQSFLSKMDTDEVSVKSLTMDSNHEDFVPKAFVDEDDDIQLTCWGTYAWWKPGWVLAYFDRVIALAEWDFEMRRIMKLTLPFALQAAFSGVMDVMSVAVVGKLMSTQDVTAYIVVDMLTGLTDEFVGGFWNALTTLCSQAVGAKQMNLCGQYVQMAILLYIVFSIPFMFLWWEYTDSTLLWFGFDEETAEIGRDFARIQIFATILQGINESIHELLDITGLENYSTVIGIAEDIVDFVAVLQVAMFASPQLYHIGLLELAIGFFFLALNVLVIYWRGWFQPYMGGLFGTFSLTNYKAVWLMTKTALSLSVGFLLTDGEWEILTLFASFLGPAEVAAWSLIGTLWEAIEDITEAIGDAAEVRCGYLLGCGKPTHARVSAYKSMLIAVVFSFLATSILFTLGEDLAVWMTNDPVLQKMMIGVLPLFGLGNITMTIGTVSWTILGAQGRYRLATTAACFGSWFCTIPLAAVASTALNFNLQGQTAAVVVGYMVSGTINAYFLFRSDWDELSADVIESHMQNAIVEPGAEKTEEESSEQNEQNEANALKASSSFQDDISVKSLENATRDSPKHILKTP